MTSSQLERALRETFAQQSAAPPASIDPAGAAIRRGRRIQRRRAVLGAALAAVATVAVSVLSVQLTAPGGGESKDPAFAGNPLGGPLAEAPAVDAAPTFARVEPPPVDVVIGTHLHTVSGRLIDLAELGKVVAARRSGDAFLVVTAATGYGSTLWLVREDRPPNVVIPAVDKIVLAPGGDRVAWRDGSLMSTAPIAGGRLGAAVTGDAPPGGRLVRFLGAEVLLARERTGRGSGGYGVWRPGRDSTSVSWTDAVAGVYGMLPDGRTAIGQVWQGPQAKPCLALLAADRGLDPIRTTCTVRTAMAAPGTVSPDGRWLIVNGVPVASTDSSGQRALAVDLGRLFDKQPEIRPADFVLAREVVWASPDTLLQPRGDGALTRVTVNPGTGGGVEVERVTVPGARPGQPVVLAASARH